MSTVELIKLLRPLRPRVKLAVVSACQSAAATTAETLRWLGLDDPAAELEAQAAQEAGQSSPMGIAQALMAELGSAVVAMRYPVIDDFAVDFADAIYDRVLRRAQPLDRAFAAAVPAAAGSTPSAARPAISAGTPAIFGASAAGLSLAPPVGKPILDPTEQVMARFPSEPLRFVGRAEAMATASASLAPESGRTAVVFHGMAGAGKTACAVELAYRHQRAFEALAFWSAPTDPDQFGDALRLLAMALEAQLGDYKFTMVDKIATPAQLENFLPRLRTLLQDAGLLLVLDNLETLLTPDGQWREPRWAPLISALTGHDGESRVILTSQILPAGLDADRVLIRPVYALSRDESLLLARELPNLRELLHSEAEPVRGGAADPALGRRVLTLVQGHPKLLELADAAAADRTRLTSQLAAAEAEAAVDGAALTAFLATGDTVLDAAQFLQTLTAWTTAATTTLPAPARLLLQALCRIEETDRNSAILDENWADLWRRLGQPGDSPPVAEAVAPLVATALVATELTDLKPVVRYRIHPGIAEAIHAATPDLVTAAVDTQLGFWWRAAASRGILQERAGNDTSQVVVRSGLAAAPYLLRQHHWDTASDLLDQVRMRGMDSPVTAQAVIAPLRRIAETTGESKHLGPLAAALRSTNTDEAETLLRRIYDQATTSDDHHRASVAAGHLITLLSETGKLREVLTLTEQKIEHTRQAGLGPWTQLSDQGRWLQILNLLGHHEQVLIELHALRARMVDLPDQPADNDTVNPWNVREVILNTGSSSAAELGRWAEALDLNDEVAASQRRRGAGYHETARTRLNNTGPLIGLGRLAVADQLLRDCQDVFDSVDDITALSTVYGARADLEDKRGHLQDAIELGRTALRLAYIHPVPHDIAGRHHNLAHYLSRAATDPVEQRAHRLAAAFLYHLTNDNHHLTDTLRTLAIELSSNTEDLDASALPMTLREITRLVDVGDGVRFGDLVAALCPDPNVADNALLALLATAALTRWEPVIAAVVDAATSGHTRPELADFLDELGATTDATTNWAALVAALRRVLAGDRDREQLLAGLDEVDTAILTAVLDRLLTSPGQDA